MFSTIPCQLSMDYGHQFHPLSRFSKPELDDAYSDARNMSASPIKPESRHPLPDRVIDAVSSRTIIKCPYNLSEEYFERLWSHGIPLVITPTSDVGPELQLAWTPQFFIDMYGDKKCFVEDTSTGVPRKTTVAEFFSLFGQHDPNRPVEKLKVCNFSTTNQLY